MKKLQAHEIFYDGPRLLESFESYSYHWSVDDFQRALGSDFDECKPRILFYLEAAQSKISMKAAFSLILKSLGRESSLKVYSYICKLAKAECLPEGTPTMEMVMQEMNFTPEFELMVIPSEAIPTKTLNSINLVLEAFVKRLFIDEPEFRRGDPIKAKFLAVLDIEYVRRMTHHFGKVKQELFENFCATYGIDLSIISGYYEWNRKDLSGKGITEYTTTDLQENFPEFENTKIFNVRFCNIGKIVNHFTDCIPCRGLSPISVINIMKWLRANGFEPKLVNENGYMIKISNIMAYHLSPNYKNHP